MMGWFLGRRPARRHRPKGDLHYGTWCPACRAYLEARVVGGDWDTAQQAATRAARAHCQTDLTDPAGQLDAAAVSGHTRPGRRGLDPPLH